MKKLKYFLIGILTILISCTKEIEIELNSSTPQIIIEGSITDQEGPYTVKITKSVNFSEDNNFPPVENAEVIISDNEGNMETLQEILPGIYKTQNLQGMQGRVYNLTVNTENQTFTASSQMPNTVNLDSLSYTERISPIPGNNQNLFSIIPAFTDPANVKNNYRFIQTANNVKDKSIIIANDDLTDGLPNQRPLMSIDFEIQMGDTVEIEMQNIDNKMYDYFYSLSQINGSSPAGTGTPANPTSNISGGALGYFSAHTVQKMSVIIK